MESVRDHFVSMFVDRLQTLEQRVDELQASNELLRSELSSKSEEVHLMPHSRYTEFSDGYGLHWDLWEAPTMTDNREGSVCAESVPLDEKHWNAVVFPGRSTIHILEADDTADKYWSSDRVSIGRVCQSVTVRELVEGVHSALRLHGNDGDEFGYYDGMLQSREAYHHDVKLCVTRWPCL